MPTLIRRDRHLVDDEQPKEIPIVYATAEVRRPILAEYLTTIDDWPIMNCQTLLVDCVPTGRT